MEAYYIQTAEGVSKVTLPPMLACAYGLQKPNRHNRHKRCRHSNCRSTFTGFDATGQKYELCADMGAHVWHHVKHLSCGGRMPQNAAECKALIVKLFAGGTLTPAFGGFRKPNTTRRAAPKRRRVSSVTADDPTGYWDVEITASPRKASRAQTSLLPTEGQKCHRT